LTKSRNKVSKEMMIIVQNKMLKPIVLTNIYELIVMLKWTLFFQIEEALNTLPKVEDGKH